MGEVFYKEIKETVKNDEVKNVDLLEIIKTIRENTKIHIIHPRNKIPVTKTIFDGIHVKFMYGGSTREILTKYSDFSIMDGVAILKTLVDGMTVKLPCGCVLLRQYGKCVLYTYDDNSWEVFFLKISNGTLNNVNIIDEVNLNDNNYIIPQNVDTDKYITYLNKYIIAPTL